MKVKILTGLLCISVLFNIAGLVFFIGFVKAQGTLRSMRRERNVMAQNLTAVRAGSVLTDAEASGQVIRRKFSSLADGTEDWYAIMPPSMPGRLDNTLIVYLHGMGSTYLEPFTCPSGETIAQGIANHYPDACILSCSYRKESSWGSDLAMDDITQNIREALQQYPIKRIVLMGTSMGGCTVLTYATQAPADIKSKLSGIVSVEGAGDLKKLYDLSQNSSVKLALIAAMGGTFEQAADSYKKKSFLSNMGSLPASARIALISATQDKIVPPVLQQDVANALNAEHKAVKLISIDAGHGAPPATTYVQGLDYVLSNG